MSTPVEATHLGKPTTYPQEYDASLLVPVPRGDNRLQYGLDAHRLPFCGLDIWHCWESGFLTDNGLPVVGILKLAYLCDSAAIVESKSLKLYLNSYNMEKLGPTVADATRNFVSRVQKDLSSLLDTPVTAHFFSETSMVTNDFAPFTLMDRMPLIEHTTFQSLKEEPALLQPDLTLDTSTIHIQQVCTHLLRSNCKITHQPDWGSAYIHMSGRQMPTMASLMQYLVSFRGENHFHEEVCEMIYKRLWDTFMPNELAVTCIYTRRGGIDICPVRVSDPCLYPQNLVTCSILTPKRPRQ